MPVGSSNGLGRSMTAVLPVRADRAMAIENYRKFLSLWKDADPVFGAEIKDAKQRLAALEAE